MKKFVKNYIGKAKKVEGLEIIMENTHILTPSVRFKLTP